jgi:formylglycine-generating enzyme
MPISARHKLLFSSLALSAFACEPAEAKLLRKLPLGAALPVIAAPPRHPARRCPSEMVDVAGRFCIDRYEATLVASHSGRSLSPFYHPSRKLALRDFGDWSRRALRVGPPAAREIALPALPAWQREQELAISARSMPGRIPNAYLDLDSARRACEGAGKRLCKRDEWVTACRGERATRHPYGERFEPGRCNVGRLHPAPRLHGKHWQGLLDPRLNLVRDAGRPLLGETGAQTRCASPWGGDRIFDMVGNLDEWIDDPKGVFLGGFYARDTAFGCDDRIEIHSADYYDYSLGARCCR